MSKTKILKKVMSFALATTFFVASMPLNITFANKQSHVRDLKITSTNPQTGYEFNLKWQNPPWSTNPDDGAVESDKGQVHDPEAYKIEERKARTGGGEYNVVEDKQGKNLTEYLVKGRGLKDGSIYEYKVTPHHNHKYPQGTNGGTVTKPAPMDPSTKQELVLFLTDIQIEASGAGDTLTVTFDNPKYNGKNIFSGYNIYYQKGGPDASDFLSKVTINTENEDVIHTYDSLREVDRITYKIKDPNLEQGSVYAVKVEPLVNGAEIRSKTIQDPSITIENERRRIGFNNKEYRTNEALISIPLNILEDGKEFLKLKWGDLSGLQTPSGGIEYITMHSGESPDAMTNVIGKLSSADAAKINTWRVPKPKKKTYYQIRVKLKNSETLLYSEIAVYDPSIVNVTPNKPNIYPKSKVEQNKSVLDLYWDTFVRPPYNDEEQAMVDGTGKFIDKNITYDVWITDSSRALNIPSLPKILNKVKAADLNQTNIEDTVNPVYNHVFNKYYSVDSTGAFIEKDIEENKVYYIKIVATKPTADGLGLDSEPAIVPFYLPARGDISTPNSLSKPPLRIKKDDKGVEMITKEEVTIEWNTKWYEIYDEKTETWYSQAAIKNGELIFGKDITAEDNIIKFYDLDSPESVKQAIKNAGYANVDNILVRHIDISQDNIKYELILKTFDEINNAGGYEAYLESLLNSQSDEWQQIEPNFSGEKLAEYSLKQLKPNTRYAILLRPYRILTDGRKDAYPTYILATTLPEDTNIDITPVSPILKEISKTDTSIEVGWKEDLQGVSYELAVSETIIQDPGTAKILINGQEIKDNGVVYTENKETHIKYNIKNLFPDTGYYIWIRATVDETGKTSDWSNPIYVRTEALRKPEPPSGLGLASQKSLEIYNSTNNTSYKPATSNYLIIEWLRDANDKLENPTANQVEKTETLLDPKITSTYMVKFNDLLANKYYYVRAKTKVYIARSGDGKIEKAYSYILNFSHTKDFKDFIEVEVPSIKLSGDKVLTAESDWTNTYRFRTKKSDGSDGDYDGDKDDDVYPLPEEDFEIIYDSVTQTLTYRFRSNKKDENGNNDNLADQRFITKLINEQVYNYKIDLTNHLGYKIKNRKVEIPYSVFSAFEERKIDFSIVANGTTFRLNSGFLNTPEIKKIGVGNSTPIIIKIAENPVTTPIITYNQTYTSVPQELSISLNKNGEEQPIQYLGSDMNIDIKLNNRAAVLDSNVSIYKDTKATPSWQKVPSVYNSEKGTMSLKTKEVGNYSTISTPVKVQDTTGNLTAVNSKIMFTDLANVDLKTPVSVVQFNNIVAGIANGKTQFPINVGLSTQDYNSLSRSGMLLNGSVVSREAGINTLVKLYEMRTKTQYKPTSNINTTQFSDIKNANKVYQTNLIKAAEIGFFGNSVNSRPKDVMTLDEVLYIVNIILDDSGY